MDGWMYGWMDGWLDGCDVYKFIAFSDLEIYHANTFKSYHILRVLHFGTDG